MVLEYSGIGWGSEWDGARPRMCTRVSCVDWEAVLGILWEKA